MPGKRSKPPSIRKQLRRQRIGAAILFIVLLGVAVEFGISIYRYAIETPFPFYPDGNESNPEMCHCYFWGCYCCPEDYDRVMVYDLGTNLSNIAIYKDCRKYVYLPSDLDKRSISDLACKELVDYLEHGRRCSGILKSRCIYPYIWNEKAALQEQIMAKNCIGSETSAQS